jgi:hypothetical protein
MNKRLLIAAAVIGTANAAPFVISDPWTAPPYPTHCTLTINTQAKGPDTVVLKNQTGQPYCSFDVATLSVGTNTLRATAVLVDPTWGRQESGPSLPLELARPGVPTAPAALKVQP